VAETHAKAAGLLSTVTLGQPDRAAPSEPDGSDGPGTALGDHPQVQAALAERNRTLSRFWLGYRDRRPTPMPRGTRCLLIEAEDTFTGMLAQQIAALGVDVRIRHHADVSPGDLGQYDIVVLGPGPGDPRDAQDPRMAALRALAGALLSGSTPFLGICLGHQVLCTLLGLPVQVLSQPNQGTQQRIELFGRSEHVGFYNTFTAVSADDEFRSPARPGTIEVCREPATGMVYGLRGPGFASVQFHPESVLTQHGHRLLAEMLSRLATPRPAEIVA
jgi:phenazine biosynthesis protein phzE